MRCKKTLLFLITLFIVTQAAPSYKEVRNFVYNSTTSSVMIKALSKQLNTQKVTWYGHVADVEKGWRDTYSINVFMEGGNNNKYAPDLSIPIPASMALKFKKQDHIEIVGFIDSLQKYGSFLEVHFLPDTKVTKIESPQDAKVLTLLPTEQSHISSDTNRVKDTVIIVKRVKSLIDTTRATKPVRKKGSNFIFTSGITLGGALPAEKRVFVYEACLDGILFFGDNRDYPFNPWIGGYGSFGSFNGNDVRFEVGGQLGYMLFSFGGGYAQVITDKGNEHGFSVHSKFVVQMFAPYVRYSHFDSYKYVEGGISFKFPIPVGFGRELWGVK